MHHSSYYALFKVSGLEVLIRPSRHLLLPSAHFRSTPLPPCCYSLFILRLNSAGLSRSSCFCRHIPTRARFARSSRRRNSVSWPAWTAFACSYTVASVRSVSYPSALFRASVVVRWDASEPGPQGLRPKAGPGRERTASVEHERRDVARPDPGKISNVAHADDAAVLVLAVQLDADSAPEQLSGEPGGGCEWRARSVRGPFSG